jgi:hypothetical protein
MNTEIYIITGTAAICFLNFIDSTIAFAALAHFFHSRAPSPLFVLWLLTRAD